MSQPASNNATLARKAVRGTFWSYLSFGAGKLLLLVTTTLLARFLTPAEFGIVGFAMLAIRYAGIMLDLGLGAALIQWKGNVEEAANTVFTWNFIVGVLLAILLVLSAPAIAIFFDEPMVVPVLRVISLTFIISPFGITHTVLLRKELDYKKKFIPDLLQSIVKGGTSIGLAIAGFGVWALVYGYLAGGICYMIVLWIMVDWRPKLGLNWPVAKQLLGFGSSIMGIEAVTVFTDNLDYLFIGRLLGSAALGMYTIAYRLPELLVFQLLWILTGVIFPTYSKIQDDTASLKTAFLKSVRYIEMIIMPICFGLALAAGPIVLTLFGEKWAEAIPVLRILAISGLIRSFAFHVGGVFKAIGKPRMLFVLAVTYMVSLTVALRLLIDFGIVGAALAHLSAAIVLMVVRLVLAQISLAISIKEILAELAPAIFSSMGMAMLAIPLLFFTRASLPVVSLIVVAIGGALGYLATLWWQESHNLKRVAALIGIPMFARATADS